MVRTMPKQFGLHFFTLPKAKKELGDLSDNRKFLKKKKKKARGSSPLEGSGERELSSAAEVAGPEGEISGAGHNS